MGGFGRIRPEDINPKRGGERQGGEGASDSTSVGLRSESETGAHLLRQRESLIFLIHKVMECCGGYQVSHGKDLSSRRLMD